DMIDREIQPKRAGVECAKPDPIERRSALYIWDISYQLNGILHVPVRGKKDERGCRTVARGQQIVLYELQSSRWPRVFTNVW
ncbi:unnamed protein product, partial [marine sediment metagenome]